MWQNLIFYIDKVYLSFFFQYPLHNPARRSRRSSSSSSSSRRGVLSANGTGFAETAGWGSTYACTQPSNARTYVRDLVTCFTYVQMYKIYPPTHVRLRTSFLRTSSYASPHIFYLYVGYKFKTASSTLPTLPTTLGCRLAARGIWSVIRVYVIVWLTGRMASMVTPKGSPPKLGYWGAP